MWRKIKSSFIFKKLFNYLDPKKKLDIIAYNTKIKAKFGLNIMDYMRYSGKYRIDECGRIKVYDIYYKTLLFEGFYSNRKKNGICKEYNEENNLIFDGEYLDGKRWKGKAKEYDEDTGKLILEYEYLNGIIDGYANEYDKKWNGIIYDFNDNIKYEIKNGCGYRKEYNFNGLLISEGEYENGIIRKGKQYLNNEIISEGEYINGILCNGKRKEYNNKRLIYEGEYLNRKRHGKGIEYYSIEEVKKKKI